MQFFKPALEKQLFHFICEQYVNKPFRPAIYDYIRAKKYGNTIASYDGAGECGQITGSLQQYLLKVHGIKTNRYLKDRWHEYSEKELSCYDHMFLRTSDEKIIIDPTWKQLFFAKSGKTDKWFSDYTEYLYSLPPVFIGTSDILESTLDSLHKVRNTDPLHKDDLWLPDWYERTERLNDSKEHHSKEFLVK
ncbi:MAG: hypothetical protein Q8R83_00470 [Legionellaceae bacterium]|nr:hypothetical protein [Legionellaceae bacterium]